MLTRFRAATALPAQDLERAKAWYKEKLDMSPSQEDPGGAWYECAEGTGFFLFPSMGQSRAEFTQIGFEVTDIEAVVRDMIAAGVTFERYDLPELKTDENGIVDDMDGGKGAWFKDSEGNLLSLAQRPSS